MTNRKKNLFSLLFLFIFFCQTGGFVVGQQLLNDGYITRMKNDIKILASDSLEGREAGSMGELWAALYIADRFEKLGLTPYFGGCYYQDFTFNDGKEYLANDNSFLYTQEGQEEAEIIPGEAYTPLPWGADGIIKGKVFNAGYGMKGLPPYTGKHQPIPTTDNAIFLIRFDAPEDQEQKITLSALMQEKVSLAVNMGAKGVVFWDPDQKTTVTPGAQSSYSPEKIPVPVIFLRDTSLISSLIGAEITLQVTSSLKKSFGKNVAAKIDHGADHTIIIGAHYDHLGYGSDGSRHHGLPAIHYGADDNASGVTGMIALAEYLQTKKYSNLNFVFIAFSAEEKGLIGSRAFAALEEITPKEVLCMLNYDMIGRVDPSDPEIQLLSSGSSPRWEELLSLIKEDVQGIPVPGSSGGSDHYHFYKKEIPVLFFFNGIHEDYHKPTDTEEKINYSGIRDVVEYTAQLIQMLDTVKALPFIALESDQGQQSRRSGKISLGFIPAHGVDVAGVQIEDVLPGKPAERGGLQAGDIIIEIDGKPITNIMDYMQLLDRFTPGQIISVRVKRDGKKKVLKVTLNP